MDEKMDIMDIVTLFISLVGAASWVPTIYQWLRRPEVNGRILSWSYIPGQMITIPGDIHWQGKCFSGTCYVLKASLMASNHPISIKEVKFSAYDKNSKRYDVEQFYVPDFRVDFDRVPNRLNRPPADFLVELGFLPENEPVTKYMCLCVIGYTNLPVVRIRLDILDFKNRTFSTEIIMPEPALIAFEKDLWIPVEDA